jgi:hypothetical protein
MQNNVKGLFLLTSLIAVVIVSRVIPHAPNFTPVAAITLLGAGFYSKRILAFIVPLASLWLSDLILNNIIYSAYFEKFTWFTSFQVFTFISIALTALLGIKLFSKITAGRVLGGPIASALIFFFITNFGSWFANPMYAQNFGGLISSYIAGLPFLVNSLASNVLFGFILFYGYSLFLQYKPTFKLSNKSLLEI